MPQLRFLLPIWLVVLTTGCRAFYTGEPDELLAKGKEKREAKKYGDAIKYFRGVDEKHAESPQAEEALYLLADTRRLNRKGQSSYQTYRRFVERYPNSRYSVAVAEGEFQLGLDHFEGRIPGFWFFGPDEKLGVTLLEHMQLHFPNHSLADDALVRVAEWQIEEKEYNDATDVLRRLLSTYPRSPHRFWARYHLARTLWLRNAGTLYDEQLLIRSRRAFEDYVATAKLAGVEDEQAERVTEAQKMIGRIDERRSEREYENGRFYERTGYPQSALVHYHSCVKHWPDTPAAKRSRARIGILEKVAG